MFPASNSVPPAIFIAGPTAVGKSEVALQLAEQLNGEIISIDSMQVYRGLDIGTAKPSREERTRVPHHLLDVAEVNETFDTAKFVELARRAEFEVRGRNHRPIFCGGTGLYFKAYLQGLGAAPSSDPELRAELEKISLAELLRELEARDPVTFARIDRNNPRRVVRALEVIRLTGKPFSEQRADWSSNPAKVPGNVFVLHRASDELRRRIDLRVDEMFRRGLVEETRTLLPRGLAGNRTALQAIGYRQVVEHLRGERGLDETIELVKVRTRQFAKRQLTWFRRQLAGEWIKIESDSPSGAVAARIAAQLK